MESDPKNQEKTEPASAAEPNAEAPSQKDPSEETKGGSDQEEEKIDSTADGAEKKKNKKKKKKDKKEEEEREPLQPIPEGLTEYTFPSRNHPAPVPPKYDVPHGAYGGRLRISALFSENADEYVDKVVHVCGWARTTREADAKKILFVSINDGSTHEQLQVVLFNEMPGFEEFLKEGVGSSFSFKGTLILSPAEGQKYELQVKDPAAHEAKILGTCNQGKYPLAGKKRFTAEFLRTVAHLRPRTNLQGVVARIRNTLLAQSHNYFQQLGFLYVHTPVVTTADCEGAGQLFQATTLLKELAGDEVAKIPKKEDGKIDYSQDFFGKSAFLTCSGQLAIENFCCGLGDVYTLGPCLRAENSHTQRHLAEFWMLEPEFAFADMHDAMDNLEGYIKFCLRAVLEQHKEELDFLNKFVEKRLLEEMKTFVSEKSYPRISYTEAIRVLQEHMKKAKFKKTPNWGIDLGSEHERYLVENVYMSPVFVYNYPKDFKAFYMRINEDGRTVAAFDMLFPRVGELGGGSQREERLDKLDEMIIEKGMKLEDYQFYRDLRMYGTMPHAGYGLGFDRLVMLATGVENVREAIPFIRVPGHAEF